MQWTTPLVLCDLYCRTQTQYLVKALGDLKRSNFLYCLIQYLRVYLPSVFDKKGLHVITRYIMRGCAEIQHILPLEKI
jgi:hypothetical protein